MISEMNCIYYKGNKKHVSKFGGILTILAYLISLFFACYFSIDSVYKKNPTSYFYKRFIPDVGFLYLNSTMFHYIELLDPNDIVVMDESSWMIFGTETYIDEFLVDFNITKESHWNYGPCDDEDDLEFKSINEDKQYLNAWCVKGYWDSKLGKYFKQNDQNYIPPYLAHGTSSKIEKNIGYGIYIAKCQNTPFRTNCKSLKEINEEFKKLLRIKVSVIENNFDVTIYQNPVVSYFLDIKNHLTGETITMNNLNFNPVYIETNDGLVFNTNKTINSYRLDFNEKLTYERGNTSLLSGWYFIITNLAETYTRRYQKIQEAIANFGGTLKTILIMAEIINFLFNKWTIILDVQIECEKLGLDYTFFENENIKIKDMKIKFKKLENISNKNTSQLPLTSISFSKNHKNLLMGKLNKVNNYIDKKEDMNKSNKSNNNIIDDRNNKKSISQKNQGNKLKIKIISFCSFLKSLFKEKVKNNNNNIRLMHKFWINKISEENIVQMDLKLYKLSHKFIKRNSFHIHNLIEDSKENKAKDVDYKTEKF